MWPELGSNIYDGIARHYEMSVAWGMTHADELKATDDGTAETAETEPQRQRRVNAAAKDHHTVWLRDRFRARLEAEKDDPGLRLNRNCMLTWAGSLVSQKEVRDMLRRELGACDCRVSCEHCRAWDTEVAV